ncbi:myosin heavy chain kinase B-like [Centruroides vittatus]|uniref:myosin heavy chain kinase B-like n=1 Tax=Centruroides vittatus TaxID=120091 RepID=UPI0035108E12
MKRQMKTSRMNQDSEDSTNSEDTDVITQNLQNEVKRQRLISSQNDFDQHSESENLELLTTSTDIRNYNFIDEPSTSSHGQNIHQEQNFESESPQITENRENEIVNEATAVEIATQERNNSSTEETVLSGEIENQNNTLNELQVCSIINMNLNVQILENHNDMVQVVLRDENIILSASSDTTVKVWNNQGEEICSLRGHIGPVKGIVLFSIEESKLLAKKLKCNQVEKIVVSGSQDCALKVWSLPNGKEIKSIYVFNGITCLSALEDFNVLIGTESGKIEIWNVLEEKNVFSVQAYTDGILSLLFSNQQVFSLSNGIFKVWHCSEQKLEDFTQNIENNNQVENWMCFSLCNNKLYLANNDWDIFILDLATNKLEIFKKSFHSKGYFNENYQINTMCVAEDNILFSKYNYKINTGCIDVYLLPNCEYNCSLVGETSLIKYISFNRLSEDDICLVTGGKELIVWNLSRKSNQTNNQSKKEASRFSVTYKVTDSKEESDSGSFNGLKNYFAKSSKFSINKLCHIL